MPDYIVTIEDNKITEVVGLVRCKDCKFAKKYDDSVGNFCTHHRMIWSICHDEDFCSEGELKRE